MRSRGPRLAALAATAALVLFARAGRAQGPAPGADPADVLVEAGAALGTGDHQRAASLAGHVARDRRPIDRQDRAEAWRILGLAEFALGRRAEAEAAFYAYLKLDPDARLDPALVPPEVIHFFEEVSAKHKAELDALRPKPKRRRSMILNFVPLGGQLQNGETTKAWIIGSAGVALLATNVTTYVLLRRWCGPQVGSSTCDDGPSTGTARKLQVVNVASGVGAVALYAYSVIDGLRGYRRWKEEAAAPAPPVSAGVAADGDSLFITVGGGF
jgi:hypothetical protein